MNSFVAVLLTCYNRNEKTITCLDSLYTCHISENYTIDVYLVDDGSSDGTSEAIKKHFPNVIIIQGSGNLFWNRGMLLAWESAARKKQYDYYLWLNDDTILFKTSVKMMLENSIMSENRRIIIGATCSKDNETVTYSGYNFPDKKLSPNNTWQNCDFFNGNIVLIPSYVFHRVGFLDRQFRHNLGDLDYGMRASKLGFVHSLSPQCLGICEDHCTVPLWRNRSVSIFNRLKHLYGPLGNNPFEFFIFERRHNGLHLAILRFFSNHLRAILPQLWK